MKHTLLLVIAMMASSAALAKDKVVDRPAFSSGGLSFRPSTVVLGQSAATIGFKVSSGGTWGLSAESHLTSGGKTYRMTKATVFKRSKGQVVSSEALDPSKHYTWEYDSVSAEFEPLDKKVKVFDFVETEKSNFNTQGIRLDGKKYP